MPFSDNVYSIAICDSYYFDNELNRLRDTLELYREMAREITESVFEELSPKQK